MWRFWCSTRSVAITTPGADPGSPTWWSISTSPRRRATTPARTAEAFFQRYRAGCNAQTGDRYTVFATVFPKGDLEKELTEAGGPHERPSHHGRRPRSRETAPA